MDTQLRFLRRQLEAMGLSPGWAAWIVGTVAALLAHERRERARGSA